MKIRICGKTVLEMKVVVMLPMMQGVVRERKTVEGTYLKSPHGLTS